MRILARQCFVLFSLLACLGHGLYRKKCKVCQHVNSKKCERCGGALDIQTPGRPRGTTAGEGYGVLVVHVTCSYGYEYIGQLQVAGYRCKLRSGGP